MASKNANNKLIHTRVTHGDIGVLDRDVVERLPAVEVDDKIDKIVSLFSNFRHSLAEI